MVDLTKLQSYSETPSFKQNLDDVLGSFNISGTVVSGVNTRTVVVNLDQAPEICDIEFFGRGEQGFSTPNNQTDPRPSSTWFKEGAIWVRGDGGIYSNYPVPFTLSASFIGATLTITAICAIQFDATLTLTTEAVQYKIVDYVST